MITLFEKYRFYKKGLNIAYSAVILDNKYKNELLATFIYPDPVYSNWTKIAHHMTICLGELPEHLKRYWLGEEITLTATEIGYSDKAVAVKVTGHFSISKKNQNDGFGPNFEHITLAINPLDGNPSDSNSINNWEKIPPIKLIGKVEEIIT